MGPSLSRPLVSSHCLLCRVSQVLGERVHLVSGRYSSLLEAHAPLPARLGLRGVAKFPSKGYLAARGPLGCPSQAATGALSRIHRPKAHAFGNLGALGALGNLGEM